MAEMEIGNDHQKTSPTKEDQVYDREKAVKAFDDTKAGVQGLVDDGIAKLPPFFYMSPEDLHDHPTLTDSYLHSDFQVPIIDLNGVLDPNEHKEIVEKMRSASEEWGFFQVINHGIPQHVLKEVLDGVRRFHEQPREVKMKYYSRETDIVRYYTNYDLLQSKGASWRDTLICVMAPDTPPPEKYPFACRDILLEYSKHVKSFGEVIFGLLSEALGLDPDHLKDIGCSEGHTFGCQYYPACPEPDRTLGHVRHHDPDFLTILLQDQIGGLQVLHKHHWIDVPPMEDALIVNIGDLLQLISNDKLKSVEHRVLAKSVGPRISLACLFTTHLQPSKRVYGPLKQLLSPNNPPLYTETSILNYLKSYTSVGGLGNALSLFKL
ncbi:1-aminocyclopropane-1-carboxylate oxidase-like protein 1 [Hibiscus syriacus]|uniref:1-aminocyclopropane-1-carboxylate oxidase-like protein 1 n=1 Tax=Hibiscus syriacus TaxID=106335 RepID=A0A6A2WUB6_HIBSY|nr:1-aminocyclopropane-1-carboxylate oxidase homolog 1-like [Hibiscus syriacus]KAE8664698.1 1-aminocyclopropane-1-carboxylate oxidase-like protein 1 [Hibiscus syriacus]